LLLVVAVGIALWRQSIPVVTAVDTGAATLIKIELTQVGTGLSGEDATHVLTNDTVVYQSTIQITASGTVTLSATFPANTSIDPASVSSQAGCDSGSTLDLTADSKTYNTATCVVNAPVTGNINWSFSAKLWGANGTVVQPTLAISGVAQSPQPPALTILAPDSKYDLMMETRANNFLSDGYNRAASFAWGLYAPLTSTGGVTGVEPLQNGEYSFKMDTSQLPSGWVVLVCNAAAGSASAPTSNTHNPAGSDTAVVYGGDDPICTKSDDGTYLTITRSDAATGVAYYPNRHPSGNTYTLYGTGAYYSAGSIVIGVPVEELTDADQIFTITAYDFSAISLSGVSNTGTITNRSSWNVTMTNRGNGTGMNFAVNINDGATNSSSHHHVHAGQTFTLQMGAQINNVPLATNDKADNFYSCNTFNPSGVAINGPPTWASGAPSSSSERLIEYGVIGTDMTIAPEPEEGGAACGEAGDGAPNFFASLSDAQTYATGFGLKVNAMRIWTKTLRTGRDIRAVTMPMKIAPNTVTSGFLPIGTVVHIRNRNKTDQWVGAASHHTQSLTIIGGRTRATLTASPDSIAVGDTERLTLEPSVDGIDTNVVATVTLPQGLSYVVGSGMRQGAPVEPTVTPDSNGTTTLVFNLGTLGSSPTGSNVVQAPLTFDVTVNTNAIMPQTMNVTAVLTSDGDANMAVSIRTISASFGVATQASFGYTLGQAASVLEPGDSQTYNFADYVSTATGVHNMSSITVLPYSGDGRGTTGVTSYQVTQFAVTTTGTTSLTLYYTTDVAVRANPASSTVAWTTYSGGTLPSGITAVKWTTPALTDNALESVRVVLGNIVATSGAVLATDITHVTTDEFGVIENQMPMLAIYQIASISGTVYDDTDLSGGLNAGDKRLAGVTVGLVRGSSTIATTTTNANGEYTFANLTSGIYTVVATAPSNMITNGDKVSGLAVTVGANVTGQNIGFEPMILALIVNPTQLNLSVTSTVSGAEVSGMFNLTAITNNPSGYVLSMAADSSNLVCVSGLSSIPSIVTDGGLVNDTWGYGLGNFDMDSGKWDPPAGNAWRKVPTGTADVLSNPAVPSAVGGDAYGVFVGTKVTYATPACTDYRQNLTVTAVADW
jgi:hypothetical protein